VTPYYEHAGITLYHGDCREAMAALPDASIDAVVTDPPYGLSFMGKRWDYDVPSVEIWQQVLRVLKPGGHLLAFAGTRTQHRMAVRIEDAGFEIRDMIAWVYGSGFPKSLDVSKAIDKHGGQSVAWFGPWFRHWRKAQGINQKQVAALFPSKTGNLTGCVANWELGFNMPTPEQFNLIRDTFGLPFESIQAAEREVVGQHETDMGGLGGERLGQKGGDITAPATPEAQQWAGWGTALKPALEPITVARKPLVGTVAANVLQYGTGGINVDGCRVGTEGVLSHHTAMLSHGGENARPWHEGHQTTTHKNIGRWPANLIHDGSDEVVGLFPETDGVIGAKREGGDKCIFSGGGHTQTNKQSIVGGSKDTGSAARFFYTAKADKSDRGHGNNHPTVKPVDLMRYLVRLVCPMGGIVLDPFNGSGTTAVASRAEHCRYIGAELNEDYCRITIERLAQGVLF
jgi:DNA modification methylase/transcriptional regulator with XRE-family HTH domain